MNGWEEGRRDRIHMCVCTCMYTHPEVLPPVVEKPPEVREAIVFF
jgi:hypothetical protein